MRLEEFRSFLANELTPAHNHAGRSGYCCPACGSGTHRGSQSTGAVSITPDGFRWHCFACDQGGDIFDVFRLRDGLNASEAAAAVREKYQHRRGAADNILSAMKAHRTVTAYDTENVKARVMCCEGMLDGSPGYSYLIGRGLTPETIRRFRLGWDVLSHRIVIPYNREGTYYISREIGAKIYIKPSTEKAGPEPIFNAAALRTEKDVVFVVESQFCAMSLAQAGASAVALGGCGWHKLLGVTEAVKPSALLIVCFDNEPDPEKARLTETLEISAVNDLRKLGIRAIRDGQNELPSVCGQYKDPNDFLQADPEGFARTVSDVIAKSKGIIVL